MAANAQLQDPWSKIRTDNPFFSTYESPYYMGGAPTSVAKSYADWQKGKEWENQQQTWQNLTRMLGAGAKSSSPWGTVAEPAPPAARNPADDIKLLKKNIDPGLTAAIESILGKVPGVRDELNLLSVDKNPLASSLVKGYATKFAGPGGEAEANRQRLDDFVTSYLGNVDKTGQYTQSDVDTISRTMGGDLGRKLETARRGIETGLQDEYTRGLGQIGRGISFSSMAGRGPSSGSDAVAASEFSNLISKLRLAKSEAQRADILAEEAAKQSLIGRREALLTDQARLGLLPLDLYNQQSDRELSQVGNLANLIYGTQFQRPEMTPAEIAQVQLSLLGLGRQQLYGNTPLNITGLYTNFPNISIPGVPRSSAFIPPPEPAVSYFDAGSSAMNPFIPTTATASGAPFMVPDRRISPGAYSYYQNMFENPEQWGGGVIPAYSPRMADNAIWNTGYNSTTNLPVGAGDINPFLQPVA